MKTRILRIALPGIVACVVLAGCSSPSDSAGDDTAAPIETAPTTPDDGSGQASQPGEDPSTGDGTAADDGSGTGVGANDGSDESTDDDGSEDNGTDDSGSEGGAGEAQATAGAEMPVSPEPTTTRLSELLAEENKRPLVSTPLPRAASARGRLVTRFPAFLRPPRSSAVASSSLSPSGDRLQVSLVASTSLSTDAVLRAYRVRLTARGLTEAAAPATVGGSQAAAFRRGASTVTVTVTTQGSRTRYSLHAVLHAGRE